jgi:adrenodoxin-NADP+ reductase
MRPPLSGRFSRTSLVATPPFLPPPRSLARQARSQSTSTPTSRPLKLAIIGAGPSGFYTASRILSGIPLDSPGGKDVVVHMYERLPTPYGLVRYGVAPDHPEVKVGLARLLL